VSRVPPPVAIAIRASLQAGAHLEAPVRPRLALEGILRKAPLIDQLAAALESDAFVSCEVSGALGIPCAFQYEALAITRVRARPILRTVNDESLTRPVHSAELALAGSIN
jgi:hypothetical protein